MEGDFKFRTGKYKNKTYDWVKDNDPSYLEWVSENRPEMLKKNEKTVKTKEILSEPKKAIRLNENFDNEPPSPLSIPYMLGDVEKYKEQLTTFQKANKQEYRLIKEKYEREKVSRL